MELHQLLKLVKKHEDRLETEIKKVRKFLEELKKRKTRTEAVIEKAEGYLQRLKTLKQRNDNNLDDLTELLNEEKEKLDYDA